MIMISFASFDFLATGSSVVSLVVVVVDLGVSTLVVANSDTPEE